MSDVRGPPSAKRKNYQTTLKDTPEFIHERTNDKKIKEQRNSRDFCRYKKEVVRNRICAGGQRSANSLILVVLLKGNHGHCGVKPGGEGKSLPELDTKVFICQALPWQQVLGNPCAAGRDLWGSCSGSQH